MPLHKMTTLQGNITFRVKDSATKVEMVDARVNDDTPLHDRFAKRVAIML